MRKGNKMYYNLIVAMTKNKGIGLDGKLPWRLPADMKYFKDVTTTQREDISYNLLSHPSLTLTAKEYFKNEKTNRNTETKKNVVIMGRKTWDSLPDKFRPLPDRINVVLSRDESFHSKNSGKDNMKSFKSVDEVCEFWSKNKSSIGEVFVIGGGHIYNDFITKHSDGCKLIYQTNIEKDFKSDTFFDIPKNFQPLFVSKTLRDDDDTTFDFRVLFNSSIIKEVNPEELISPDYFSKYDKHEEYQYLEAMKDILENGHYKQDRTGVGTISKFGLRMSFDVSQTFPLLTTKDTFWRGIVEELIWFIKGDTKAKTLQEKNVKIWDGNSSREYLDSIGLTHRAVGDLGPVYGFQWRHFGAEYKTMHDSYTGQGVDQLREAIRTIQTKPQSRRILLSAWNPSDLTKMALPPCHVLSQFYVEGGKLNLQMYQRSGDMGLGVPFNIASYSLLLCMVASVTGLQPGKFVHVIGDAHVYSSHVEAIKKQLTRTPKPFPVLKIKGAVKDIEDYTFEDFQLVNYSHWPKIKMEMAV